jgi:hypothetical protein
MLIVGNTATLYCWDWLAERIEASSAFSIWILILRHDARSSLESAARGALGVSLPVLTQVRL